MHRINYIAVLFIMLTLSACIKSYDPQIDSNAENKYVVSGRITDAEGWQTVDVSRSSPIESPKYIPVGGCQVNILDNKGNVFSLDELQPGKYRAWIDQEFLVHGNAYRVKVTTPGGEELLSGFDTMSKGPRLDSVYYYLEDVPTADPEVNLRVMQFYVDLDARGDYSQYYKWEIEETWEYHAAHPGENYYDGTFHHVDPPDYSRMVCWANQPVRNVFTVSTRSLSQNTFKKYPLHYIDGTTSRLSVLYSMLVSQFSMSKGAYNYWEQLRINSNEQGGLYEKQPLAIKGNLLNVTTPEKKVLGYFFAASVSSRRYFYQDIEGVGLGFNNYCFEEGLGLLGWKEFFTWEYPVYYYYNAGVLKTLSPGCIDCQKAGGTLVKPDFWPY
jgi:hypothetical protein